MTIAKIRKNGAKVPTSDRLYTKTGQCFDMFFLNEPENNQLPEQMGYCMGRCDALILNTM